MALGRCKPASGVGDDDDDAAWVGCGGADAVVEALAFELEQAGSNFRTAYVAGGFKLRRMTLPFFARNSIAACAGFYWL